MVAPRWPVACQRWSRSSAEGCQRMSVRVCVPGLTSRGFDDGARADGVVGGLVDQDERAAVAVLGVGIGDDDRAGAQRHGADVVERQLNRAVELVEGLRVQPRVQLLNGGPHGLGGLLERQPVTGPQRGVDEPAHRSRRVPGPAPAGTASSAPLTNTSPRPTSMSSASSIETDSGATPVVRSSSSVSSAVTVERVPAGSDTTGSPTLSVPAASRPV